MAELENASTMDLERSRVEHYLKPLSAQHRAALDWFWNRRGQEIEWPEQLADGTFLATRAKGIYKPKWSEYALSVRQTIGGPYPDRDPEMHSDGSWTYAYFQEKLDPAKRDVQFTNTALVANQLDQVPVAVMRQVAEKPVSKYKVLGIGLVTGWDAGYFRIEGFASGGELPTGYASGRSENRVRAEAETEDARGQFQAPDPSVARERMLRAIAVRRGQPKFRRDLVRAYGGSCAISGCHDPAVLEAAHILPYRDETSNHVQNGLLLRADLHTLFDLELIAFDPATRVIYIAPEIVSPEYRALAGRVLRAPSKGTDKPHVDVLGERWKRTAWAHPPAT